MKYFVKRIKNKALRAKYNLPTYEPKQLQQASKMLEIHSAWKGLEQIIPDIIERFNLNTDSCLEFGTEFCFSTVALSNYFDKVIGVDTFIGDDHSGIKQDHYESTSESVEKFNNIHLIQSTYQEYIKNNEDQHDLIHVDIIHDYKHTYQCGLWAATHSSCAIFHDTESFMEVRHAVYDIAKKTGKKVYNYPHHNGLGIIV
ncbi:class I SAM-dependent methyltransferase [Nonlabens ponticola]|uniref:Class I SAM-dependent methyltransferase n=1 Tax=Nonlabens ponticola TaxID=2496866 RepID=A0A3S9MYH6_9FLAO|nr:class I SAM-dependent methyltransferase [Nonlabens ponticola]AZQ44207.1 class I SAM-dependent methyltransferase [Nonlabens ponticola]